MRSFFASLLTLLTFLALSFSSFSQLRFPAVISSGMVLQQNDSVTIWGWGSTGQQVKVTGSWNSTTMTGKVANTAKWSVKLKTPVAGGPYTISIKSDWEEVVLNDILIGEVWLCSGQSNMEWSYYNKAGFIKEELPTCYNNNIRFFHIPRTASDYPQEDVKARWQVCDSNSLKGFSAVGYYFGKKLNKDLNVPIGLINASWGGTPAEVWAPAEVVNSNTALKEAAGKLQEFAWWPSKPGLSFNGMLAPVTKFSIAGAIWYQGESNTGTNNTYTPLLTAMIDSWRKQWDKTFPFYYVQIAPFKYGNHNVGALIQEQQTKALNHPGTGMVVITDLVDTVTDIHPSNKRDVGNRLANWALAETYHKDAGAYKNPMFSNKETVKGKLSLRFTDAPAGLVAKNKTITGFFISGEKEEWLPAEAKIEGDKIVVWNKALKEPVHVRYGFGNTIIGNVFSKEGLPLCPFRTDDWPVDQSPVK
ncbi:MAG: sialate O-acetylesterase [Chitinophagaceae bacterium]|nr:sialate O-acetylesterase [Chitinophagaceae bacterium]